MRAGSTWSTGGHRAASQKPAYLGAYKTDFPVSKSSYFPYLWQKGHVSTVALSSFSATSTC